MDFTRIEAAFELANTLALDRAPAPHTKHSEVLSVVLYSHSTYAIDTSVLEALQMLSDMAPARPKVVADICVTAIEQKWVMFEALILPEFDLAAEYYTNGG